MSLVFNAFCCGRTQSNRTHCIACHMPFSARDSLEGALLSADSPQMATEIERHWREYGGRVTEARKDLTALAAALGLAWDKMMGIWLYAPHMVKDGGKEARNVLKAALSRDHATNQEIRYRALIKKAEKSDRGDGYQWKCPWCGAVLGGDLPETATERHLDDCPAFTPSGDVR